jgi:hypothetical protein
VLFGRRDHRLEELAVRLLHVCLPGQLCPRVAQAQGERVADALQLPGSEDARAPDGPHLPLESPSREGRGEGLSQRSLQAGDLPAQVVARAPLGGLDRAGSWRLVEVRRYDRLAVFEHFGHSDS